MKLKLLPLLMAILLAGCGGGSRNFPENNSLNSSSKISNSLNSTSSSSIMGEAINGHLVPPEPDPILNNSTLEGVDANNNGVRDDVERSIARQYIDQDTYQAQIFVASKISKIMEYTGDGNSIAEDIDCSSYRYPDVDQMQLFDLYLNNEDRINRYSEWRYSTSHVFELTENDIGWNGADLCR